MDFSRMFETWLNVTTRPGETTFEAELNKPQANLTTAIIWIIIAAVVLAILSAIGAAITGLLGTGSSMIQMLAQADFLPPEARAQLAASAATGGATVGSSFCGALIGAPIAFLIGSLIYFVVAKLFGGVGTFEQNAYILATFAAPLMVISGALNVIPILGPCLSLFVSLYQIYLTYLAMKVTHRLSNGAAWMVALTPVVIALLCVCLMFLVGFSLIAAMAGSGSLE